MNKKLNQKLQAWVDVRKRYRLSHAQIQMARELGLNPKKLGGMANHDQEPWKTPLPQYIERLYARRFDRERPEVVRSIEESARLQRQKKAARREQSRSRKSDDLGDASVGRGCGVRELTSSEIDIHAEIDYVVGMASARTGRIVRLGVLLFFSVETGDAWLLETEGFFALPLARDGGRLPVRVVESAAQFVIEWSHDYRIEGDQFLTCERATGTETVITGYPTHQIAGMCGG